MAGDLRGISQGLELLRPYNVMKRAAELPGRVAAAAPRVEASLPPFSALLARVSADYGQFALDGPHLSANRREALLRQFALIEWYWTKQQIVHAVAMAREWLVTLLCLRLGLNPEDRPEREGVEALLNDRMPPAHTPDYSSFWSDIPHGDALRRIWQSERRDCRDCLGLADLRNSIAHAGQTGGMTEENVLKRAAEIVDKLRGFRDAASRGEYDPIPGPPPTAAPRTLARTQSGNTGNSGGGGATIGERLRAKGQDLPPQ